MISQMWTVVSVAATISLPSGEKQQYLISPFIQNPATIGLGLESITIITAPLHKANQVPSGEKAVQEPSYGGVIW